MKRLVFFPFLLLLLVHFESGIYSINVVTLTGDSTNLSDFAGKKIIVLAFDPGDSDISILQRLSSLQDADSSVQVIEVPGNDLGQAISDSALESIRESLSSNILFLKPALVKKDEQENQHPLFKWLTDVNANMHFDVDVDQSSKLFIISKGGTLYSEMPGNVDEEVLSEVLEQEVDQP